MSKIRSRKAMELPSRKLIFIILMIVVIAIVLVSGITNFVDTVRTGITDVKTASGEYYEEYGASRGFTGGEQFEEEGAKREDFSKLQSIDDFSQQYNVDKAKLMAIIEVESSSRAFYSDGHPIVRFECVKYNRDLEAENYVPCDVSSYRFGSSEDTGRDAFERALEINEERTLLVSSYGSAQILGSNYQDAGFTSVKNMYEAMFTTEGQTSAFLKFLKNNKGGVILEELQKENTDWAIVALHYNGAQYEIHDYDGKLIAAYERNQEIYG